MSLSRSPPLFTAVSHALLGLGLAVILLFQVYTLEATAPSVLDEHAETASWGAMFLVAYAILPFAHYFAEVVGDLARRRFFGGETA